MRKASHRPAAAPERGGASFAVPRAPNGRFAKWDAPPSNEPPPEPASSERQPATTRRAATPAQLVTRVTRAIDRELSQIEDIVGGARVTPSKRTEAEKRARTLASLARTLSEVARLRSAANEAKPDHDSDAVPRDLDEFRRTLERRLAQMADRNQVGADRADDAG